MKTKPKSWARLGQLLAAAILMIAFAHVTYTQTQGEAKTASTRLRFFDSMTGFAVEPDNVVIDDRALSPARTNRLIDLRLNRGQHKMSVKATGYEDIVTDISVESQTDPPISVVLSPTEPPMEFRTDSLAKVLRPEATAAMGFVSDEQKGGPLPGVIVRAADGSDQTMTNDRGFFLLYLPTRPSSDEPQFAGLTFEKNGYTSEQHLNVRLAANDALMYQVVLKTGEGSNVIDEDKLRRHENDIPPTPPNRPDGLNIGNPDNQKTALIVQGLSTAANIKFQEPASIRVGSNCNNNDNSRLGCTTVAVVSFRDYCKRVLPNEWTPGWDDESLKAGAIAARTYATWFVKNPISTKYDICANTACQSYSATTSLSTNNAVDSTVGIGLLNKQSTDILFSEFAAETNNHGCGQGQSGEVVTQNGKSVTNYPCFSDTVCNGASGNGHGRGMCQNGSHRWASGLIYGISTQGVVPPHDWRWIIDHYYGPNGYSLYIPSGTVEESISTPALNGPTSGSPNAAQAFVVSKAASNFGAPPLTYEVDWGDGSQNKSASASLSHSWSTTGQFTVKVRARSAWDTYLVSSFSNGVVINITPPPPSVSASCVPSAVAIGSSIAVKATWTGSSPPYQLSVNGQSYGQVSGSQAYVAVYPTKTGTFTAQVAVKDNSGQQGQASCTSQVYPVLAASCAVTPNPAKVNQTITWQATGSGGSGSYSYSWLNGTTTSSYSKSYSSAQTVSNYVTITDRQLATSSATGSCSLKVNK